MEKYRRCRACEKADNSAFSCFFIHADEATKAKIIGEAVMAGWREQERLLARVNGNAP